MGAGRSTLSASSFVSRPTDHVVIVHVPKVFGTVIPLSFSSEEQIFSRA